MRMKKNTKYNKRCRIAFLKVSVLAVIVSAFFLPSYMKIESDGDNMFTVFLNGAEVGVVGDMECIDEYMREARRELAKNSEDMLLMEADVRVEGQEVYFGRIDSASDVKAKMEAALQRGVKETLHRSYTVKINQYTVNLASSEEVHTLLQSALDKYDSTGRYSVKLVLDPNRELNVLTTQVEDSESAEEKEELASGYPRTAGLETLWAGMSDRVEAAEKDFSDYELGLKELDFADEVEIVEAYLQESELTSLEAAIMEVTKDQEKNKIYEVVSGDTLSGIALENNLTMDKLIAMNESLTDENSVIRVGDELIVTVPEPELSVDRMEEEYYEEDYEAEVQYVPNDDWYTTEQRTLQEPSAGHRIVVADVYYRNNAEVSRDILKEEITYQAVPKIVERGTKIPPTYIKPISGGRLSSGFGRRSAPTKGASTYHKGIDWATPVGTAVMASSAGTVTRAGWGSGYGYVIYIRHADGKETRYGHLSKVLVKPGQSVQQGQKIALSGNTGRSTGPHLHFEILVNGSQVNPLNYLN